MNDQEKNFRKCNTTTFHIVKTESDELPLKLKWDAVEGHERYLHLLGMSVRKAFHKACAGNHNLTAQSMGHHTCLHRNTYLMVLKARLCMCIHFFLNTQWPKSASPTADTMSPIRCFFSHLHLIFFPSSSQYTIHLDKEQCFRSPSALPPSSLLFYVNEISLYTNKKPITQRHASLLPHTKN